MPYQVPVLERVLTRLLPVQSDGESKREHWNISYQAPYSDFSHPYGSSTLAEQWRVKFFNSFRNGDGKTMEVYKEYKANDQADLGNGDALRSEKNRLIRLVTELTHLSTEVGGSQGEMILLNEFYINFLETITSPNELAELEENIIYSFYQRLHQSDKPRYSPIIERARHYIFQHLSDDLSLKDIAKEINVHKGYLSSVFKKEVGEPVSQYINRLRIKEAKELLSITDYSLLEISSMLGYNSQSYFTRVFKQIDGIGPKEFRVRYKMITKG
jgi:YesN/AraC family two-component response regulator